MQIGGCWETKQGVGNDENNTLDTDKIHQMATLKWVVHTLSSSLERFVRKNGNDDYLWMLKHIWHPVAAPSKPMKEV